MDVILLKEVKNLGGAGQIKKVNDGFARNFLFPKKLAVMAGKQARAELSKKINNRQTEQSELAGKNREFLSKARHLNLTFKAKASGSGRLFAAISKNDILRKLQEDFKLELSEKNIVLDQPLKEVGQFKVKIKIKDEEAELLIIIKSQKDGEK